MFDMNPTNNDNPRQETTGHDLSQQGDIRRDHNSNDLATFLAQANAINQSVPQTSHNATSHDTSQQVTPSQDNSRPGTIKRDMERQVATEENEEPNTEESEKAPDSLSQGSLEPKSLNLDSMSQNSPYRSSLRRSLWIEIDQTVHELEQRGIKRTVRSIQRYCKKGKLTCKLVPTENAVRYLIERTSIDAFVKRHNQTMPSTGFESSLNDKEAIPETNDLRQSEIAQTHLAQSNQQSELILSLKDQQINMLTKQLEITNKQLDMKDEQISAMLERDHETNVLIQNLQNLVALPSGGPSTMHPNAAMASNDDQASTTRVTDIQQFNINTWPKPDNQPKQQTHEVGEVGEVGIPQSGENRHESMKVFTLFGYAKTRSVWR